MTPFRLIDAHSAAEAVAALHAMQGSAQVIAAGGDLLGLLTENIEGPALKPPSVLINLATVRDMAGVARGTEGLRLGAMTTLASLAAHPETPSMIVDAVGRIASPQLRRRTTLGGNLLQRPRCLYFRHPNLICFKKGGTGCPAVGGPSEAYPGSLFPGPCRAGHPSDLAPALIALKAEAELLGPDGTRKLPLLDLYDGASVNATSEARLGPAEILTAILIPPWRCSQAFEKIAPRNANEFSVAAAAVAIELADRCVVDARVTLGGVSAAPLLWRDSNGLMIGRHLHDVDSEAVAKAIIPLSRTAAHHPARVAACRAAVHGALVKVKDRSLY